jgi:serine protease
MMHLLPRMSTDHLLCLLLGVFLMTSTLLSYHLVEGANNEASQENDGPLPVAGRIRTKQRQDLVDTAGQKATLTIGFKSGVSPAAVEEVLPQGAVVLYRYTYVNAIVVEMDTTLTSELYLDDNVEYIEEASPVSPSAETIPWGIPVVQADDVTVPPPDPSQPCFTICIVDSGFSLRHEDLVCKCVRIQTGAWFRFGSRHLLLVYVAV